MGLKLDSDLIKKYGVDAATLIAALSPQHMLEMGRKSGFFSSTGADYPWDIRDIEGRVWFGFSDTDLQVLLPDWKPEQTKSVFASLVEKGVLETQSGSKGVHYSFSKVMSN